jgi:hypothetical protein
VVDAAFVPTELYKKTGRAREAAAHAHSNNDEEDTPPPNPLLTRQEAEEKRRQEIVSSFLTGVVLGGLCVGGVWLAVKYFKPCASVLEEAAEEAMTSV